MALVNFPIWHREVRGGLVKKGWGWDHNGDTTLGAGCIVPLAEVDGCKVYFYSEYVYPLQVSELAKKAARRLNLKVRQFGATEAFHIGIFQVGIKVMVAASDGQVCYLKRMLASEVADYFPEISGSKKTPPTAKMIYDRAVTLKLHFAGVEVKN